MSTMKRLGKPKSSKTKNLGESNFIEISPQTMPKTTQKRQRDESSEEDIFNVIGSCATNAKINKENTCVDNNRHESTQSRVKLLDVMDHQLMSRKKGNTNLLKSLSEVVTQLETDHEILKENEKKLEHFTEALVKCLKQATMAQNQKLKTLKDICTAYKKECDVMEKNHKAEAEKLANEMEEDMSKLQQKLITETKHKQMENLRRTILQFQKDF